MRLSALVLTTATLFSAIIQSPAMAADAIGKVAATVGTPSASGPAGDRQLKAGAAVYEDDKIVVRSGNAQIILADGTKLVIGPGSTLVLDRFLMQGGGSVEGFNQALRGTFRFITGRSAKNAYDIQTANATIGIRGTGFDFWTKQQTGVAVMEGSVNLCQDKNCVTLREGCEVGRTGGGDTRKLEGRTKGTLMAQNLPFLQNQNSLRTAFHLPIKDCKSYLPSGFGLGGQGTMPEPERGRDGGNDTPPDRGDTGDGDTGDGGTGGDVVN